MSETLRSWLEKNDLEKYAPAFIDNEVQLSDLPHLTEDDLKDLGLPLGPRRRFLAGKPSLDRFISEVLASPGFEEGRAAPANLPSSAERRQITVLFSDLVGSTALSADLDPEDMRDLIKTYQDACAGAITRFEGFVAKFMGDGVLAYFGFPQAHEDDAELAVRAGLSITEAVARHTAPTGDKLAARIGIATGIVVVGDLIGANAAQEQAVIGDAPNLAARLQSIAGAGQVIVSDATRRLLGSGFEVEDFGQRDLKGLTGAVPTFLISGEHSVETRFEARSANITEMVGRDQELALLLERWSLAKSGEGQGVLLVGEAGIGKSRIVRGLLDVLAAEDCTRIQYQCSPYQTDSALSPAIQQLRLAAGLATNDAQADQFAKLERVLARGGGGQAEFALIAELFGLGGIEHYGLTDMAPALRRARTLEALTHQLLGLAAVKPVLLVLEDAHWADPTTLELMELCLDAIISAPVLVLMTSRPDNQPEIAAHPHVTRLTLNRLARASAEGIIRRMGGGALPPETRDAIIARTDGVPLFVEELTKVILETGKTSIPSSLHDSLMARLDRIPDVKEVAQIAACIGREFDQDLLLQVVDLSEEQLHSALNQLAAAELIFRRGPAANRQYLFKHALVRDAAYESLLRGRREAVHSDILLALERQGGVASEILARHAEFGGRIEAAAAHWRAAGETAIGQPAYKEAIANFNAAIRLCQTFGNDQAWQREELELQVQLGQALIANLGYQATETTAAFERGLALAEAIGDQELLLPSIYGVWASRYIENRPMEDLADRAVQIARGGDSGRYCVALRMQALGRFHAGQFRKSLELVDQALVVYDTDAHRHLGLEFGHDPRAAAMNYKAWSDWHLGLPDHARAGCEASLAWARAIDHPNTIGLTMCFGVAITNIWLRDIERVQQAALESIQLSEEKSLSLWDTWGRVHLGWVGMQRGGADAPVLMRQAIETAERIGVLRYGSFHLGLLADGLSRLGDHTAARATIEAALKMQSFTQDIPLAPDLYRYRANIRLRISSKAIGEATADLEHAIELSRAQGALSLELRAATDLARIWAENGKSARSASLLQTVCDQFVEGFDTPDFLDAKSLLDQTS